MHLPCTFGHRKSTVVVAAMSRDGTIGCKRFGGTMSGMSYRVWIRELAELLQKEPLLSLTCPPFGHVRVGRPRDSG